MAHVAAHNVPSLKSIQWTVIVTIFATSLALVVNVNDSTLLKPPLLFVGTATILILFWRSILKKGQGEFLFSHIHAALLLFLLIALASFTQALNKELALRTFSLQVSYAVFFAAGFHCCSTTKSRRLVHMSMIVLASVVFLVGLVQAIFPSLFGWIQTYGQRNIISTFGNTTYFSGFLVLVIPLLLSEGFSKKNFSRHQIFLIILFLLALYLLVMTESRSAWVALIVSCLLFFFLWSTSGRQRWIILAGFGVAMLVTILLFPALVERRLSSIFEVSPTSSLTRRLVIYDGAWRSFLDAPILGHGIGNFIVILPKYRSPDYWMSRTEDIVPHAHNEFLEILSETGMLGFLFWILPIFFCLRALWKAMKHATDPERTIFIGYACSIVAVLVDNLASMNLRTVPVATIFWFILGVASRQAQTPSRTKTVQVPSFVKKIGEFPFVALVGFLVWYVPIVHDEYLSDRSFLRGLQAYWRSDPDAATHLQRALTNNPNHPEARFYLAANLVQKELYKEALINLQTLLANYPYYPKAKMLDAVCRFELRDTAIALKAMEEALSFNTSPQTLYYAASLAYRTNNPLQEYYYIITRLDKNRVSRRNDYVQQGVLRLAELCPELDKETECRTVMMQLEETFHNDTSLVSTIEESLRRFGR
jgi:O-antigen ligase